MEEGGLVNDVTITDRAVYFSDSFQPVVNKLALNANGIAAVHGGKYLVLDQTDSGRLYKVNRTSGEATGRA